VSRNVAGFVVVSCLALAVCQSFVPGTAGPETASATASKTGPGGVKNLIFAANGPKPELVLRDAVNNDVEIARNGEFSAAVAERDGVSRPALRRCTDWR
jgi:hypothetical protein